MNKKCIHCDIDGTIFKHRGTLQEIAELPAEILDGVQEKFKEWNKIGHYIIVESARPDTTFWQERTKSELLKYNLSYNRLILGITNYPRVLINDEKPYLYQTGNIAVNTAEGIMIKRDKGLKDINI